jgi:hypothetical protein
MKYKTNIRITILCRCDCGIRTKGTQLANSSEFSCDDNEEEISTE